MGQVDERVQGTGELLDLVGLVDLGELTSVLIERVGEELGIHPL